MATVTLTLDDSLILKLPQPILAQMVLAMTGQDLIPAQPNAIPSFSQPVSELRKVRHKPIPWSAQEKEMLFFLRDEVKDNWNEIGKVLNRRPFTCSRMYFETKRRMV